MQKYKEIDLFYRLSEKDNSQLRAVRGDGISNWEIKRLIKATNGFMLLLNAERKRWKIFQYLEALKN